MFFVNTPKRKQDVFNSINNKQQTQARGDKFWFVSLLLLLALRVRMASILFECDDDAMAVLLANGMTVGWCVGLFVCGACRHE